MKKLYQLTIILLLILNCGYSHAHQNQNQKILIVLTSHTELGNTGKKRVSGYLN